MTFLRRNVCDLGRSESKLVLLTPAGNTEGQVRLFASILSLSLLSPMGTRGCAPFPVALALIRGDVRALQEVRAGVSRRPVAGVVHVVDAVLEVREHIPKATGLFAHVAVRDVPNVVALEDDAWLLPVKPMLPKW